FHVLFEKEPFRYGGELDKKRGLNWEGVNREEYPSLAAFLDRATHRDAQMRFANVSEALRALNAQASEESSALVGVGALQATSVALTDQAERRDSQQELSEQRIEWLLSLLQSYPGSRWGNPETRG